VGYSKNINMADIEELKIAKKYKTVVVTPKTDDKAEETKEELVNPFPDAREAAKKIAAEKYYVSVTLIAETDKEYIFQLYNYNPPAPEPEADTTDTEEV
jgi:hypothetical protein